MHETPALAILVLTMHNEDQFAVGAIRAGAKGYLTKESASTKLVGAIRKVASGHLYISTELSEQLVLHLIHPANDRILH